MILTGHIISPKARLIESKSIASPSFITTITYHSLPRESDGLTFVSRDEKKFKKHSEFGYVLAFKCYRTYIR